MVRPAGARFAVAWTGQTGPTFTAAYRGNDHEAFDLVNDTSGDAMAAYDLSLDFPDLGVYGAANRVVCVPGEGGSDPRPGGRRPDERPRVRAVRAVSRGPVAGSIPPRPGRETTARETSEYTTAGRRRPPSGRSPVASRTAPTPE